MENPSSPLLWAGPEGVQIAGQEEEQGHGSPLGLGLMYGILVLQQGPVPVPGYTGQGSEERW